MIVGYSTGTGSEKDSNAFLNQAVPGAQAEYVAFWFTFAGDGYCIWLPFNYLMCCHNLLWRASKTSLAESSEFKIGSKPVKWMGLFHRWTFKWSQQSWLWNPQTRNWQKLFGGGGFYSSSSTSIHLSIYLSINLWENGYFQKISVRELVEAY